MLPYFSFPFISLLNRISRPTFPLTGQKLITLSLLKILLGKIFHKGLLCYFFCDQFRISLRSIQTSTHCRAAQRQLRQMRKGIIERTQTVI